jgi:hypothetical protein
MTANDALKSIGEALYGEHWANSMADDLDVSGRSLRRWANGSMPIPQGVWEDLMHLIKARRNVLTNQILMIQSDFLPKRQISAI